MNIAVTHSTGTTNSARREVVTYDGSATAKMVAVIYQKAPYAVFSLRSGANVTKPEQLENLEIASGAGSFTQKVIAP